MRERRTLVTLFMLLTSSSGIRARYTKKGTAYRSLREARLQCDQWLEFILGPGRAANESPTPRGARSAANFMLTRASLRGADVDIRQPSGSAKRALYEHRVRTQFERHADAASGDMDIMQFLSLFEEVVRYRLAPQARRRARHVRDVQYHCRVAGTLRR